MNNLLVYSLWRWLLPLLTALGVVYLSLWYISDGRFSMLHPIAQARADSSSSPTSSLRSPLEIEVRQFIEAYFEILATGNTENLMQFYAEQIDYYTWGSVDKMVVAQEKRDYFARWPQVQQNLLGEIDIKATEKVDEKLVTYLLSFTVHNPQQKHGPIRISGQARHIWRLRKTQENWEIIEEKQRVLSRQRNYQEDESK